MVRFHQAARRHIPECGDPHVQRCEIPKPQSVSVCYIYTWQYFSVWIVKSMKYFKQNRAKECMEVCWYDVLHKMWCQVGLLLNPGTRYRWMRKSTYMTCLISWWWASETKIGYWCVMWRARQFNLLKRTGHGMHQQFNIQQLYVLPTLYLCVLYLSENKQRLVPLTA